jgi:hypothetical protein
MEPTGIEPVTSCCKVSAERFHWFLLVAVGSKSGGFHGWTLPLIAVVFRKYLLPACSLGRLGVLLTEIREHQST